MMPMLCPGAKVLINREPVDMSIKWEFEAYGDCDEQFKHIATQMGCLGDVEKLWVDIKA